MHILLIEDEPETATYVVAGLQQAGHEVVVSEDGRTGLLKAASENWDLLIVDRMLPGLDGLALVRMLRTGSISVPVLFLTTMGGVGDRVAGLRAGGDDYLVKPFAFSELEARVEALGRRSSNLSPDTVLRAGDLEMDLLAHTVTRAGRKLDLQRQEFKLLEYLLRHGGRVVTRTMLLENVWGYHFDPRTNVVDSHISRLRGKIGADLVHTVRGAGYCVRMPDAPSDTRIG
ncbi:MAG TPA: response regulator transcription factor [Acetobacteraceae bacterium]|nr:response regulator transcription factor [Acetobacteraceae bacterium]